MDGRGARKEAVAELLGAVYSVLRSVSVAVTDCVATY